MLEDHIAMKRTPSSVSSRYAIKDSRKNKPVRFYLLMTLLV